MFKPSLSATEPDLFSLTNSLLSSQAVSVYNDPNAWHNQFYSRIKCKVDEHLFEVLFDSRGGAPNASISTLVSMMILKDMFGWTDRQLFETAQFHILVRKALGLTNLHDALPTPSTFYLLRKRMYEYNCEHGIDLMDQVFRQLTSEQMQEFDVSGQKLRMDSKLLSSNVARYGRHELIHRTLTAFCRAFEVSSCASFTPAQQELLTYLLEEKSSKVVFNQSQAQLTRQLDQMGWLIYVLLGFYKDHQQHDSWKLLKRVFEQQYEVVKQDAEDRIRLLEKERIAAGSVQSPDDPDCAFRTKGDQQVKGYVANVTETVGDQPLNLISDVRMEKANTSDPALLTPALKGSEGVSGCPPQKVYLDGGYQSPDHQQNWSGTEFVYTGIQGGQPRYELERTGDELLVTDTLTGQACQARKVKSRKENTPERWAIRDTEGKHVYFDEKAIRASRIRREISERCEQERNMRNNIEATIFHLFCKLKGNKSPYRGLFKQSMMLVCRAISVNFHRIVKYVSGRDKNEAQMTENMVLAG